MRWDLFCRVIDNHGDTGVCWRLACDLAARGEAVRLWLDDASALAWMAPGSALGVDVLTWSDKVPSAAPQDVVIEAFGCDPPAIFVAAMAAREVPPVWINLEHLSAEPYVERSHGLPSPQMHGPGRGLTKWFFYPGFTPRTGGLIREPGLIETQAGFDRRAWLAAQGIEWRDGERVISVFAYPGAPLPALLEALAGQPVLLLLTPGTAQPALPVTARSFPLPWLTQPDYDRLLWSCDLNLVRGEDSLVRAMWAGQPFIWQIYPQHDGAHAAKLQAFADAFGAHQAPGLGALWRRWNSLESGALALPDAAPWRAATLAWRDTLLTQADLTHQLLGFVRSRRPDDC